MFLKFIEKYPFSPHLFFEYTMVDWILKDGIQEIETTISKIFENIEV